MKKILVEVKPGSSKLKIEKLTNEVYRVNLTAQPVDGKANQQLIKVLAKYFKVAKSLILIKNGKTSKTKIIEMPG